MGLLEKFVFWEWVDLEPLQNVIVIKPIEVFSYKSTTAATLPISHGWIRYKVQKFYYRSIQVYHFIYKTLGIF